MDYVQSNGSSESDSNDHLMVEEVKEEVDQVQMATIEQEDDSQEPGSSTFHQSDVCQQETDLDFCQVFIKIEEPDSHLDEDEGCSEEVKLSQEKSTSGCLAPYDTAAEAVEQSGEVGNSNYFGKCDEIGAPENYVQDNQPSSLYSCPHCEFKCVRFSILKEHIEIHLGIEPCVTENSCSDTPELRRLEMNHKVEKRFDCGFCDYKTSRFDHLRVHLRSHAGDKPFSCEFCDFKCSQSSNLKRHLRCHTGDKPFSCEFCNYKASQLDHLKTHLTIHTGDKPLSCKFCDYKTGRSGDLRIHIRSHTGDKPFSCEFCDYKTGRSGDLRIHIRSHTGDKPFSCEFCDFRTSYPSRLKTHLRTHTGDKPFSCEFCDFKTGHPSSLKAHQRIHTKDKH